MSQPDTAEAMRLHLLGERDSARAAFEKLLAPRQSLIANYYLAQLKLKQNRYAEALDLLEELLQATPHLAEAHFLKGMVFMGMHRNVDAVASFRKTLELNPNDTRALGTVEMLTEVPEP